MRSCKPRKKATGVFIVAPKIELGKPDVTSAELCTVGTLAQIENIDGDKNNGFRVKVRGVSRFKVEKLYRYKKPDSCKRACA